MKQGITLYCFLILLIPVYGQEKTSKSDLRVMVELAIQDQIEYAIDSTTNKIPPLNWDSTKHKGIFPSFSSYSDNPMTLIVLNGEAVTLNVLDKYKVEDIAEINVFAKNHNEAMAIYGLRAKNGMVVIQLKE